MLIINTVWNQKKSRSTAAPNHQFMQRAQGQPTWWLIPWARKQWSLSKGLGCPTLSSLFCIWGQNVPNFFQKLTSVTISHHIQWPYPIHFRTITGPCAAPFELIAQRLLSCWIVDAATSAAVGRCVGGYCISVLVVTEPGGERWKRDTCCTQQP